MVRRITIVGLIMYCMVISPAFAGMWVDDFEDGNLDGWGIVNPIPAEKWAVEDGKCSGQWANAPADLCSLLDLRIENSASWKDYNVACRAKLVEKVGQNPTFGIWFRFREGPVLGYNALICLDDKTVAMHGANKRFLIVPLPFDISEDIWYELEVIAEGEHFEFYIDDELVGSFEDDSLPPGTVGLSVGNTHVHFDDVVITGPEIPDGGTGFAVASQSKLATMWGSVKCCP